MARISSYERAALTSRSKSSPRSTYDEPSVIRKENNNDSSEKLYKNTNISSIKLDETERQLSSVNYGNLLQRAENELNRQKISDDDDTQAGDLSDSYDLLSITSLSIP